MIFSFKRIIMLTVFLLFNSLMIESQEVSEQKKLIFSGDVRFRAEQDWNSRKSDGSYRDNRFRLRLRARAGLKYSPNEWASFAFRIRTGFPEKQQDPQITLGDGYQEFDAVPIYVDKLFFGAKHNWLDAWIGRNSYTFEKQNELFWSDNVSMDGLFLSINQEPEPNWIDKIKYAGGIFTMLRSFATFDSGSYIGILQMTTWHWNKRLKIFPTFYHFNAMPDVPDGNESYRFDYSILQLGLKALIFENPRICLGLDLYQNIKNYSDNEMIPENLKDQKSGIVGSIVYGSLSKKGDFALGTYVSYLERYSAVDFIAQNDWVRWDYSSQGSKDGRLTNFKGLELMTGYKILDKLQLKIRYFVVEQLVPYGTALENGNRIRFDIDFNF